MREHKNLYSMEHQKLLHRVIYCLAGAQFASTRAEPKGKASDGAGRSQCVYLVKSECDCMSLFWKHLVMCVIHIIPSLLLPWMMSLVVILLSHG